METLNKITWSVLPYQPERPSWPKSQETAHQELKNPTGHIRNLYFGPWGYSPGERGNLLVLS